MPENNTMTKLEATSTTPFESWEDWHGKTEDGDIVVVTFETMSHHLYESWFNQAVEFEGESGFVETEDGMYRLEGDTERKVDHGNFDSDKVEGPGIYQDKEDDCYTIILSHEFMTFKLCQRWIEKLNEEFGTTLELVEPSEDDVDESTAEGGA